MKLRIASSNVLRFDFLNSRFWNLSIKFFSFLNSLYFGVAVIFTWRSRNREIISYAKWDQKTKKFVKHFKRQHSENRVCWCEHISIRLLLLPALSLLHYQVGDSLCFGFNLRFGLFSLSLALFLLSNFRFVNEISKLFYFLCKSLQYKKKFRTAAWACVCVWYLQCVTFRVSTET